MIRWASSDLSCIIALGYRSLSVETLRVARHDGAVPMVVCTWCTQEEEAVLPEEDEVEIIDAAAKGERMPEAERNQICGITRAKSTASK